MIAAMFSKWYPEFDPLQNDLHKRMITAVRKNAFVRFHVHRLPCCTAYCVSNCVLLVGDKDLVSLVDVIVESY
jgi:hypothetical protein